MPTIPVIRTARSIVTILKPEDFELVHFYFNLNADHLRPWDPIRDADFYSLIRCRGRVAGEWEAFQQERALHFYALNHSRTEVLGRCSFSNIVRGPFQACHLGYSIGDKYQGQGLMTEILEGAIKYVFETVKLHRIMANYIPRNKGSGRVLEKLGFEREGKARSYLKIAGVWEDHVLTSKINPDD
ncbi:MAG: GNAT family N-acetyltransferase [Planctomycetota bacterium]|nr:GNAT family N-acetyltransferase [Planctomycetota bacterium]